MKKNLRYYLLMAAVMMVVSMSAQIMAQEPVAHFQSTSTMVGSGSTLPQAAYSGAGTATAPGYIETPTNGPRRVGGRGDKPKDPMEDPIGELPWLVMVVLAGAYAILRRRGDGRVRQEGCTD